MAEWLAQVGDLPTVGFMLVLGAVMMLDAVPLLGVLVPGDVAVLTAVSVGRPIGGAGAFLTVAGAFIAVVGGCLSGWSLSFLAGRQFGERLRSGRFGRWIGARRWDAAERILQRGGGSMVLVAPFLPVLNALLPLAAGGLRMPYRRFVAYATAGSVLWAGLYVLLALAARALGGLLPGETFALLGTVTIGLVFGWLVLLSVRRRLSPAVLVAPVVLVDPAVPAVPAPR